MTPLDEWIEFARTWLDEQLRTQQECDEAAYRRFRVQLLGEY